MDIRMPELDGLEATRRILAADAAARVLILTTFDLDEYIFEALSAGASGFVLKDDPPEQLITAIRTVAGGDALLSPAVTNRVIRQFARLSAHAAPEGVRRADRARARRLPAPQQRPLERGDRARAVHRRDDGQDPRHARPAEARPPRPRPGGRARAPERAVRLPLSEIAREFRALRCVDAGMRETFPAGPPAPGRARRAAAEFAAREGADAETLAAIELCISEAVTNAVVHAYRDHDRPGTVEVEAHRPTATCASTSATRLRADAPGRQPRSRARPALDLPGRGVRRGP